MAYVVKAALPDPVPATLTFAAAKTMYGGKHIAVGDTAYLFASDARGTGLVARGTVTAAAAVPRVEGAARQTPRVTVSVGATEPARRPLGRAELKRFADAADGPECELNFKLYRQATDKIVGVRKETAAFLATLF